MTLTDDQFAAEFRGFTRSAFRIDRTAQPLGREADEFRRYLAGSLTPPTSYGWLGPWLAQLAQWRGDGKTFTRVRVLAEPPTEYQRWLVWGTPWMTDAGEDICYLPAAAADLIGLPAYEWCMFDSSRVIEMRPDGKTLITDPVIVAGYTGWRDMALQHSAESGRGSFAS